MQQIHIPNPIVEIHHDYDRLGNRLNRTDVVAGAAFNEAYQYDQQNQLIDLDRTESHEHFHYDSTGNWLAYSQNDTLQTRTHNAANEIVTLDGSDTSIRTDAAGNMTRLPNFNLTYDAWNRLVRVTSPDGTTIAAYTYDGLNRRILKTTSTETRRFYYNRNWQCLLETAENQPSIHYTWGLRYVDDLICRHVGLDKIYSLPDPNWNVVALVDTTATPVERYTYNAFGKLHIYDGNFTPHSSSNYNWTRTFTGQVLDTETGLMLYRNRFYSPTLGRFLTRDPIGYEGLDENLYRYARNLVAVLTDPTGLISTCQKLRNDAMKFVKDHPLYQSVKNCGLTVKCDSHCLGPVAAKDKKLEIDAVTASNPRGHEQNFVVCFQNNHFGTSSPEALAKFIGLLLHELTHVAQSCDKNRHSCPSSGWDPRWEPQKSTRDQKIYNTCIEQENEAYSVQARHLYPLDTPCQKLWREWLVEHGTYVSCNHYNPTNTADSSKKPTCDPGISGVVVYEDGTIGSWNLEITYIE